MEYARKVREMRAVQKQYFAGHRSSLILEKSKRLEQEVDALTSQLLGPEQQQSQNNGPQQAQMF